MDDLREHFEILSWKQWLGTLAVALLTVIIVDGLVKYNLILVDLMFFILVLVFAPRFVSRLFAIVGGLFNMARTDEDLHPFGIMGGLWMMNLAGFLLLERPFLTVLTAIFFIVNLVNYAVAMRVVEYTGTSITNHFALYTFSLDQIKNPSSPEEFLIALSLMVATYSLPLVMLTGAIITLIVR
jgi:hypothetical protein